MPEEWIVEREADGAPTLVEELESIMMNVPAWAKGWPVYAKGGWMGQRYGKFD